MWVVEGINIYFKWGGCDYIYVVGFKDVEEKRNIIIRYFFGLVKIDRVWSSSKFICLVKIVRRLYRNFVYYIFVFVIFIYEKFDRW